MLTYSCQITPKMIHWANRNRKVVAIHVNELGIGSPTVDPLDWRSHQYVYGGSPESQAFLVMLLAAWRNCKIAGVC